MPSSQRRLAVITPTRDASGGFRRPTPGPARSRAGRTRRPRPRRRGRGQAGATPRLVGRQWRALPASTWHIPADLGLLALGAALSVGLGVWRGQTIRVWREADGTWWRQGSVRTLALRGASPGAGDAIPSGFEQDEWQAEAESRRQPPDTGSLNT
jgi:hypothetical protein